MDESQVEGVVELENGLPRWEGESNEAEMTAQEDRAGSNVCKKHKLGRIANTTTKKNLEWQEQ